MAKKKIKKALASKTIWFNGLTVLMVLATFFGFTPNEEVAEMTTQILLAFAPMVNVVLRFVTKEEITI